MAAKARVLIAEDSATQAMQLQMFLEEEGYAVELAVDGRQGLEMARTSQPDIVVTDLEMPEMNGLELVEALHNEQPRLPLVLITAKGSEEIAAEALTKGASSYVPKKRLQVDLIPTLDRICSVTEALRAGQRLSAHLSRTATEFLLENDTSLVPALIGRFQEDLSLLGLADEAGMMPVAMALDEALTNAIIHGNLEVSSELREIDDGHQYVEQIEERRHQEPYSERRVSVLMKASRGKAMFVVRDEGPGFDVSSIPDPTDPANLERPCGRGLMLINTFMDEVKHNDAGNEVTMVKLKANSEE